MDIPPEILRQILQSPNPALMFSRCYWPGVVFYSHQQEIIGSIRHSYETFVTAGNMLGKDFVAGFIAPSFFICPQLYFDPGYVASIEAQRSPGNPHPHTVRIVTTSVRDDHLRVLWGEIGRFLDSSRWPLSHRKGGPLVINHREIKKRYGKETCKISYLIGMVSEKGEGMAGHHAAYTLLIVDEASGVDDLVYSQGDTWAKRKLVIGNPNPCNNFFFRGVEGGDVVAKE